ncbi:MAG: hypothetical protein RMH77_06395 [Sulfolobales archaeon]|nr:hypothetical protein [Sulfolobales archaeon]MCX8185510.1 hypothetical protein [Sulfolobales archaeon]MDW7970011.1 hypothetical protein [Sulfolobales archaeon]
MSYSVFTAADVKNLMRKLSTNLKCGERVEVVLHDEVLASLMPSEAIYNGLSIVDAYEIEDKIVMVVENRFNKCL